MTRMPTYIDVELNPGRLCKVLRDFPEIPLIVLVKEGTECADFEYTAATRYFAEPGFYMSAQQPFHSEFVYTDADEFESDLEEYLWEKNPDIDDDQFEELFRSEISKYESYWKQAVLLWIE